MIKRGRKQPLISFSMLTFGICWLGMVPRLQFNRGLPHIFVWHGHPSEGPRVPVFWLKEQRPHRESAPQRSFNVQSPIIRREI